MSWSGGVLLRSLLSAACRRTYSSLAKRLPSTVSISNFAAQHQHPSAQSQPMLCQKHRLLTSAARAFASDAKPQRVNVTFVTTNGDRFETWGYEDDSLYDVVVNRNIPLDGFGACEATLACSTCHCIFTDEVFEVIEDDIGNVAGDEELDMLDLAYGLVDTSRLGCQIKLDKKLEGIEVTVPAAVDVRG